MRRIIYVGAFFACFTLSFAILAVARQGTAQHQVVSPPMEKAGHTYEASNKLVSPEVEKIKPQVAQYTTVENRSSTQPLLRWARIDTAVAYEVEILKKQEGEGEVYEPLMPTKRVYMTGYNFNLPEDFDGDVFYWRVRGIDLDGNPVSSYSEIEPVYVDRTLQVTEKPTPLSFYNQGNGSVLLYPVYDWIPIPGADKYEIEILNGAPENPNGIEASAHRIDTIMTDSSEQYDPHSRISHTPFYWRVRGMDNEGHPVGVYSDAVSFRVDPDDNYEVATLGDSISHGGGSISYSPSDWSFSYQHYLDFPSINVAQSGDTSAMTVERFERDVLPFHPKYLLIMMGSNSLREGVSAGSVVADMKTIKAKCLEHGIKPVFLTLPPVNPANIKKAFDQDTVDNWQEQFALANAWIRTQVHIEITAGMTDGNGELYTYLALDGLHLDPPGKQMIGAAINADWERIQSLPDSAWEEDANSASGDDSSPQ